MAQPQKTTKKAKVGRPKKSRGRRANGEGSLYPLQDGRWCYAITFRGETKPRYFTGKTPDEAVGKKNEVLKTLHKNGFLPKKNKVTVEKWMVFWLENYKTSDLSDSGYESYEDEIDLRITPHLGKILLMDLRTLDVQQWVNKLSKAGRKDGKGGLAPKTVVRTFGILRQALDKAVEDELIPSNPAGKNPAGKSLVNLPKIPKPQIKHMPIDDAVAFLQAIKKDYMYPAIMTDLILGLRRGELLGLKWKDVDFKKGTILIRRQLLRRKAGPELAERVKTDSGYRELELPPELIVFLEKYKREQLKVKRQMLGEKEKKVVELRQKRKDLQEDDLIFCWPDGDWYAPDHLYRHLQRLLKKHGFERLSVHGLRHTYATSAVALGTDLAVLQKNLGHADGATTTIYLHSDRKREKEAAAKLEQTLLKR